MMMIHQDLWKSYLQGLVVGVVLLLTLGILVPGSQQEEEAMGGMQHSNIGKTATEQQQQRDDATNQPNKSQESTTNTTRRDNSNSSNNSQPSSSLWSSPHAQMNAVVYTVIIAVALYTLNQEYQGILLQAAVQWFPKEAALLGLIAAKR